METDIFKLKDFPVAIFAPQINPEEILLSMDFLLNFTFTSEMGVLMLSHLWDIDNKNKIYRYFCSPLTSKKLENFKNGQIDIREALTAPLVWVMDMTPEGKVLKCGTIPLAAIEDEFPEPGVLLAGTSAPEPQSAMKASR
jgi:hypothetical protein